MAMMPVARPDTSVTIDAHLCSYCDRFIVDLPFRPAPDGKRSEYISAFRLDIEAVNEAVRNNCSSVRWALDVDVRMLEAEAGKTYLDNHISGLPGVFTNDIGHEALIYEEFEGFPNLRTPAPECDLEEPYLKLYLKCYTVYDRRHWVSKIMARSDKAPLGHYSAKPEYQLELVPTDDRFS
jgi:hypothetical protein